MALELDKKYGVKLIWRWDNKADALLYRLWKAGKSASEIAPLIVKAFNLPRGSITRKSVLGRKYRLDRGVDGARRLGTSRAV